MHGGLSLWHWIFAVIAAGALGAIPGAIARHKGRSFWLHWVFGAVVFPVALLSSIVIPRDAATLSRRAERKAARG
jgi:peptidoglycan/LPS O-acetylase OafA/YrhL